MKLNVISVALIAALSLAACGQKSAEQYQLEAEKLLESGDQEAAIIALKNAISVAPQDVNARYLLGKVYLERGIASAAEKELRVAYEFGELSSEVLPLYVKALYMQHKDTELLNLVDEAPELDADVETTLLVYKALSLFRTDKFSEASSTITRANELSSESAYSLYGLAHMAMNNRKVDEAIQLVDQLIAKYPEFSDAYLLRAQLAGISKKYDAAVDSLSTYIDMVPEDNQAKFIMADLLVKDGKFDEAEPYIDRLLKVSANNPYLNQLRGVVRFNQGDFEGTKEAMEKAINYGSTSSVARLLAGIASYKLDNLEQAHKHLSIIQNTFPSNDAARKLYAEIQLRLGYDADAFNTLNQLDYLTAEDVGLFTQASFELIEKGMTKQANELLSRVEGIDTDDPMQLARIGVLKLSLNDLSGVVDLEQALASGADMSQAKWALARSYLDAGDYDKAMELANDWIASEPQNVDGYNYAALVYLRSGKVAEADAKFAEALTVSPNSAFALNYFADKALKDNRQDEAIALTRKSALGNPDYIAGLFKYFVLEHQHGDTSKAMPLMKEAFERHPDDIYYRLNYARALSMDKRPGEVVDLLSKVNPSENFPSLFWRIQIKSYLTLNEAEKALELYSKWQVNEPNNIQAWLGEVVLHDMEKRFEQALTKIDDALGKNPNNSELGLMKAHYLLLNQDAEEAKKLLNALPDEVKSLPFALGLAGRLQYADGQFDKAIPLLKASYSESPNANMAVIIANAYRNNDEQNASLAFLEEHLKQFPLDAGTRLRLAERYMEAEPDKAIKHYEIVVEDNPENIMALNNLAWLLNEQGDPALAEKYVAMALRQAPKSPVILDTYGSILLKQGKRAEAIEKLKMAAEMAPHKPQYRQRYEQVLAN
ncbi:XrtA/PEP-CTERM system TPR-repeat protein PrsT [Bowmanella pacifica]|uniref:PEP-CTERM system TPR-repeat lipoprotein n=1 Tax=Bowmanella pacifica TaxID=502051 RepID=A0A917YR68_9ALTE|nr:XrtA/PEP-CTERM system TPR-repeat protein PrsT [Bowmanella pacifica]GGO63723.1 hypothetical protein GCM10010982_01420 [Bowmanella pacifica]